jgi:peptidoglycan L-alanyl-D-glutamate endopeptidase CwlK
VGVFDGPKYLPNSPKYKVVGGIGQELGLEWGGNWTTIVDQPHFQLRPDWAKNESEREMLVELFRRHENGLDYYA